MVIPRLNLGSDGTTVSRLGLGCFGMSGGYGPTNDNDSIATIQAALDAGITMLDTGDFYGAGHSELLIREALKGGRRERAFIAVKFGSMRMPDQTYIGDDVRPAAVKNYLTYSLRRLGTDYVDLYMPSRISADVPVEETVGAIAEMVAAGYVRHIGLSEVSAATVRRACAVHPIAAVQIEYSLLCRDIETTLLPTLRELGIALTAYGVLGRGLLSDTAGASAKIGQARARQPRFSKENLAHNLALVDRLRPIAKVKGISIAQLALAWVQSRGGDIITLVGARRRDQLAEALESVSIDLTSEENEQIETAMPLGAMGGTRYNASMMATLDSERTR